MIGRACFAGGGGYIHSDMEDKGRVILFRHLGIRFGRDLDFEGAIALGLQPPMGDSLVLILISPPPPTPPPPRHPHISNDVELDTRSVNRSSRIAGRVTGEADFFVQLRRDFS